MSELYFLLMILDLVKDPDPVAPGVVVFGLHLKDFIDQSVLLQAGLVIALKKEPSVLP